MATRKKAAATQAAPPAQGAPEPTAQAPEKAAQGAPGAPRSAPTDPGRPDAPGDQGAPPRPPTVPGLPRDYKPESRTIDEARAELAKIGAFPWPYAGPVHGIAGFSKLAGWAQQTHLGGEKEPEDILGNSGESLLILITQAKQLEKNEIVQNALVATHAEYGDFYLRAVKYDEGFLMGIIDQEGATYCACEYYDSREDLREAWNDWIAILNK